MQLNQGNPAEYHRPGPEQMPASIPPLPQEDRLPREESYSLDEFNESYVLPKQEEKNLNSLLRRLLQPTVAVLASVSLLFASLGIDPLRSIGHGNVQMAAAQTESAPPAAETTIAPSTMEAPETTAPATEPPETTIATEPPETTAAPTTEAPEPTVPDDEGYFPELSNLDPDFEGDYAWSGLGPEEFIRFIPAGEESYSYLIVGAGYETATEGASELPERGRKMVQDTDAVSYDINTNTLTLNNFSGEILEANLMGNGFTIRLSGANRIGNLVIWGAGYAGSVKLVGDGTLTLPHGLFLEAEGSQSCLMVGSGVTLDLFGDVPLLIRNTSMEQAVYLGRTQIMEGGEMVSIDSDYGGASYLIHVAVDASGQISSGLSIHPYE